MSTNKTTNYQLHKWEADDDFLRSEFNENFAKLDEAARVVVGAYTGDGSASRFISLGFTPKAVFVLPKDGQIVTEHGYYGGLALPENPVTAEEYTLCQITANGFQVGHASYTKYNYTFTRSTNASEKNYHYLAVK